MPPRNDASNHARPHELPHGLVNALGDELAAQDDYLTSAWTLLQLAPYAEGIELVRFDPEDKLGKPSALGVAWLESLHEAGAFEVGRRTTLVRQAVKETLAGLLRLVEAWEREAGTTVLEQNWTGFERSNAGVSRP
jgi:hypothetical protein